MEKKGFSLLELIISMAIIFFFLVGLAQALLYAMDIKSRYHDHMKIMEEITKKCEYFKSLPFESSELNIGTQSEVIPDNQSQRSYVVSCQIWKISPCLKAVKIACHPENKIKPSSSVTIYLSKRLGF